MIYCFSGTGNTRHIAEMLSLRLGCEMHAFTANELREPSQAVLKSDDTLVIWMFPTYSWGVPPVIREIIRCAHKDFRENALHIAVTTCGDDIGDLPVMFRRDIMRAGLKAGAVFSVAMPNTYVMMKGFDVDSEELARRKIAGAVGTVETIARAINDGRTGKDCDRVVKGKAAWLKTAVVYPYFTKFEMSPKGFTVNSRECISCGKCVKACPMDNIALDADKHPVWGDKCAFCTACYHICPVHAVDWKGKCATKGQARYF